MSEMSDSGNSLDIITLSEVQHSAGRRSKVWEHFERVFVNVDGELKAVCKYCQKKMQTKSGTSSLIQHIAVSCPAIEDDVRKSFVSTMKKQPSEGQFVFDPQLSRERMIDFIIHAEIPFRKFDDPYFQPWMDSLQPTFKGMGRHTIRSDVLKKYKTMKQELQAELASLDSRVCITTDMWTSNQNLGYMAVTAHYIDASFNYRKKTISFEEVKYPHTGFSLVQDGMRVIHAAVEKTRELLKHIDSSPSRLQSFNALALANGMKPKSGIYLDVPNRWNSTYKMLKEAMEYKAVLNSYANQNTEGCPTDQEWDKAASICDFLKAFEELTNVVSAHREPTAHKFLPVVLQIRHALKDPRWQPTRVLKDLAAAMHSKLDKYWDPCEPYPDLPIAERWGKEIEFNLALVIATILDPRRKGLYVDFFYEKVAHNMASIPTLVESAIQCMRNYFEEYK